MWPSPDSVEGVGTEGVSITVEPDAPSKNFEFIVKISGLPSLSGVVIRLDGTDHTDSPTWLTHKSDPNGNASVVWRSSRVGVQSVAVMTKNDHELGKTLARTKFEVVDPGSV